ncbi:CD63 antigen-like [Polistes fuscatus]|uniref:CD63 antigen-like n=1 Tax=Polistes fuscatus TaxID=30207 RepID=UPI001CA8C7B6|nr:CD63 antigen-like [Polistes fuscatus]
MMRHQDIINDNDTETDTAEEEEITETEESSSTGKVTPQQLTLSFSKLFYKRLPKKCVKFSFLSLNSVTFLAGLSAVIISIWMLADSKMMSRLIGQRIYITTLLMIGIFASILAVIGISGFFKRKSNFLMIVSYIIFHALFLFSIFICSVLSFSLFDKLTRSIHEDMSNSIENYRYLDWVTEAWDNTHRYLKCCGIRSYEDWIKHGMLIPQSCCSTTVDKCLNMSAEVVYESGCLNGAVDFLKSSIHTVSMSALFVSLALFANLFFALAVRKRFKMYPLN